jgi:hypothetical protein
MKTRTVQEEQVRQLKIMNAQMAPLGVFVKVGFYLFLFLSVLGCLARFCLIF